VRTLVETLIIMGVLGLGAAAAMVTAGGRLQSDYREGRTTLASPYP
jgi:hypothetical protein